MSFLTATLDTAHGGVQIICDTREGIDGFSRTVSNGWGNADDGQPYTISGGSSSNYSVAPGVGSIVMSSVNVSREVSVISDHLNDFDMKITTGISAVATGAPISVGLQTRKVDTSNYYLTELVFNTDATLLLRFSRMVGGVLTTGFASILVPNLATTAAGNATYNGSSAITVRTQVIGTKLRAKVWDSSVNEPTSWLLQATDTNIAGLAGIGLRVIANTGNTNSSPTAYFVNLLIPCDAGVSLFRITPDGTTTPVRGNPVISSNNQALFFDDEAPLNTNVYYGMNTNIGTASSNTVVITGGSYDIGWLKDPTTPSLDVPIVFQNEPKSDCAYPVGVTLTNIESETFATANGMFEIVNAANPAIVSMLRKSLSATIHLVTQSLADAAALEALLGTGRVLLLQLPSEYGWSSQTYSSTYINVLDVARNRMPSQDKRHPQREYVFTVRVTNVPASTINLTGANGIGLGRCTYGTMQATGLTYGALNATNYQYMEIAQGLGY
jgi:hypothetical protein